MNILSVIVILCLIYIPIHVWHCCCPGMEQESPSSLFTQHSLADIIVPLEEHFTVVLHSISCSLAVCVHAGQILQQHHALIKLHCTLYLQLLLLSCMHMIPYHTTIAFMLGLSYTQGLNFLQVVIYQCKHYAKVPATLSYQLANMLPCYLEWMEVKLFSYFH